NSAVVRFVGEELASENRRGARHVLWLCYRLALGTTLVTAAVVCGGICLAGDHFLELTDFARIALMTACTLSLQGFCNLSAAALRGMGEMRYSSILGGQGGVVGPFANSLFLVLVVAAAACTRLTLESTLVLYVASFAVVLTIGSIWVWRTAATVFAEPTATDSAALLTATTLLTACLPMMLVQILSVFAKQGALWVAGATCTPQELALYAGANRAIQLVGIPLSFVNLSVMGFIPQLRMQGRLADLERVLRIAAGWAAIPSFLALVLFLCAPGPVLELFLGEKYRDAALLLSILSFGQFALVWVGCSETTLVLSGHARSAAVINIVSSSTILVGGYFVASSLGITALAILAAAVLTGQCIAQWLLARQLVGVWTHAAAKPWRLMQRMR
ncbi:MAG TPA: MATE family efflux transporter, partial [Planctomycetaceae bacterium]|nr:MATE family efflux transporter [Planctomycetaceae bacterium]